MEHLLFLPTFQWSFKMLKHCSYYLLLNFRHLFNPKVLLRAQWHQNRMTGTKKLEPIKIKWQKRQFVSRHFNPFSSRLPQIWLFFSIIPPSLLSRDIQEVHIHLSSMLKTKSQTVAPQSQQLLHLRCHLIHHSYTGTSARHNRYPNPISDRQPTLCSSVLAHSNVKQSNWLNDPPSKLLIHGPTNLRSNTKRTKKCGSYTQQPTHSTFPDLYRHQSTRNSQSES